MKNFISIPRRSQDTEKQINLNETLTPCISKTVHRARARSFKGLSHMTKKFFQITVLMEIRLIQGTCGTSSRQNTVEAAYNDFAYSDVEYNENRIPCLTFFSARVGGAGGTS